MLTHTASDTTSPLSSKTDWFSPRYLLHTPHTKHSITKPPSYLRDLLQPLPRSPLNLRSHPDQQTKHQLWEDSDGNSSEPGPSAPHPNQSAHTSQLSRLLKIHLFKLALKVEFFSILFYNWLDFELCYTLYLNVSVKVVKNKLHFLEEMLRAFTISILMFNRNSKLQKIPFNKHLSKSDTLLFH